MKVSIDGAVHNRCNLCTEDAPEGENHCDNCKEKALKRASQNLDDLCREFDTELGYWADERILEGRR
jgi:predicted amidophosphoribosyltransferase